MSPKKYCSRCGRELTDVKIKLQIDGGCEKKVYWFCMRECLRKFTELKDGVKKE